MVLQDKVAVVTGASGGIGASTARVLAELGARVVVGYKSGRQQAEALVRELAGTGHTTEHLSLEDGRSAVQLAARVKQNYGRADILVNSAGFTKPVAHRDLDALTDELFDEMLVANVRGPFSVVRAFVPLLKESGNATVVNISSVSGFTGSGSSIAYCACKAALDTMSLSLARVLGPEIRVMCVSPGAVATDFVPGRDRVALEKIAAATPLRKVVEPEDVANAVAACIVSMRASTGIRIVVDGGRFLG